jgi:hypothetical protein
LGRLSRFDLPALHTPFFPEVKAFLLPVGKRFSTKGKEVI